MAGKVHRIKCAPEPFAAVKVGLKAFEFRLDDRDYQPGDVLVICEFDRLYGSGLTGDEVRRVVTYKLMGGAFGVPIGYCVLSLGAAP